MKINLFLILSLILFVACEQPNNELSLNGEWEFFASNEMAEEHVVNEAELPWDTLTVPGNWDTSEKYAEYSGKGYYKRVFKVPANWKGSQVRLKFDAVYETSKVWLNGQLLGKHIGGYTPFEFNITSKVKPGREYELLVMADNTYKRGAWWGWGGISRNVKLIRNEDVRMVYQHISALPNFDKRTVDFEIKYKLENNAPTAKKLSIVSEIIGENGTVVTKTAELNLSANSTTVHSIKFTENLSSFLLWHFNTPNLYTLNSVVQIQEQSVDSKTDKFGIRKLEARGEQLYLNDKAVYMNGFNRVHDHPDYGNTEPDELVQKDIMDMKTLGAVFSRLMHAPQAKNLLEFCDSVGYLIIEEIPVWGHDDPQAFKDNPLTKQWLKEMIERDFNHACVVGWSVGNELRDSSTNWDEIKLSPNQYEYINSMLDFIDELDTTRLKTYVSLTSYKRNASLNNEPFEKLDILCLNSYGDAIKAVQNTHAKFPGKPIFVSEIGQGQIGPAPEGKLSQKLVDQLEGLKEIPYVVGSAVWSYNDYRSNYKGTPESGFREWGVVDEKRNRKMAWDQIKKIYSN